MTIEEKAKAYDNVREKIAIRFGSNVAKEIFSEYEESEDEEVKKALIQNLKERFGTNGTMGGILDMPRVLAWFEKQGKKGANGNDREIPFDAWSEKDKKLWVHDDDIFLDAAKMIVEDSPRKSYGGVHKKEIVPWFYSLKERLKSLRPQSQWNPSEEMLEALYRAIPENVMEISEDEMLLDKLYQGLKYDRVLSNKQ